MSTRNSTKSHSFSMPTWSSESIPNGSTSATLSYRNEEPRRELKPEFQDRENRPLRGLFGLSRDLVPPGSNDRDALDPDAQDLVLIRNYLEHKHLE